MPKPRTRQQHEPPPRLNWPPSSSQLTVSAKRPQHHEVVSNNYTLKRSRRVTFGSSTTKAMMVRQRANTLWTMQHTPQSSTTLVVATKKVQEIREWIMLHTTSNGKVLPHERIHNKDNNVNNVNQSPPPPMLILVGSPGIGKSTTVRCLALEMELDVLEWTESFSSNIGNWKSNVIQNCNSVDSFEQFLQQCGSDILPLAVACLKSDSESSILGDTNPNSNVATGNKKRKKFIVIDELPYTHASHTQKRLQQIITTHVRRLNAVPTIFIYSDTAEGKIRYDDLERFIHPQTLYAQSICHSIAMNPPTITKFRKVIHEIIESERTAAWKQEISIPCPNNAYVDELYERCNGDLRFAIVTLQFEMIGDGVVSNKRTNSSKLSNGTITHRQHQHRDSKLSPFHALGKLLYAKRLMQPNDAKSDVATNSQPPLDFDPDAVIRQTDMELGNILHFLSYHSVDFFTDVDELSTAMTLFSDSSVLCDYLNAVGCGSSSSASDSASVNDIATSIVGRVVAHANKHPAQSTYRSLSAPKVYDMMRKRRDNQDLLQKYSRSMWLEGSINSNTFAMDLMPYIRVILPNHRISTSYLDSMFSIKSTNGTTVDNSAYNDVGAESEYTEALKLWKQQEDILRSDDIIDDIDDADGW